MKQYLFLKLKLSFVVLSLFFFCGITEIHGTEKTTYLVDYVNPFIGTTGWSNTEYGGRIPAVMTPFAMTQWSPLTRETKIGRCPYNYKDKKIIGFTGTHQPAIWMGDNGFISFMPQCDKVTLSSRERGQAFSHKDEVAHPYYYSVVMGENGKEIKSEHTASTRCSFFKFSFPQSENNYLSVEMSRMAGFKGYVKIDAKNRQIIGYNSDRQNQVGDRYMGPNLNHFAGYFVLQFDTDFTAYGTYTYDGTNTPLDKDIVRIDASTEATADYVGAYIKFDKKETREVKMKVASSFISIDQAKANLKKEIKGWNFDKTLNKCRDSWEDRLKAIEIEGGTHNEKVLLYTCMYNALMYPSIFSEYGKYYSAFDDTVHEGVSYNSYSLWDTFRAEHPLLVLIAKDHVAPMITALLQMYDEGGWLPKWPNPSYTNIMIGTHADAVIADAYVKGIRDFDLHKAYKAVYKNAMVPPDGDKQKDWKDRATWTGYEGRGGLSWYKKLGFVPVDKVKEAVSRTLEFAYGDFCVAQMAKAVGNEDDYNFFMNRSKNYRNVFNKESGLMHPRFSDGSFAKNMSENRCFTEGSYWTYLFCVMQDVPGLVDLMGGKEVFEEKLDRNFKEKHYRHANEPGHHYIYLYDYINKPWKTQELVAKVMNSYYKNTPDGLCGNDDCGQMSAWYIFGAMGFYPVCPGSDEYAIGTPLFEKMTLNLGKGKTFTIKANNLSKKNKYVKEIRLDGKVLSSYFIKHADILNNSVLEFDMHDTPCIK